MSTRDTRREEAENAFGPMPRDTNISLEAEKYSLDDACARVHALLDAIEEQWNILLMQDQSGQRSLSDAISALTKTRLKREAFAKRGEKHVPR